jgi:hypothetical protein
VAPSNDSFERSSEVGAAAELGCNTGFSASLCGNSRALDRPALAAYRGGAEGTARTSAFNFLFQNGVVAAGLLDLGPRKAVK